MFFMKIFVFLMIFYHWMGGPLPKNTSDSWISGENTDLYDHSVQLFIFRNLSLDN